MTLQKNAHRGFIAQGGEIKGPAAEQASKKAEQMEGNTLKKQAWTNNDNFTNFGEILEAFWEPKGLQKLSEILDAIWRPKRKQQCSKNGGFLVRLSGLRGV